MSVLKVKEHPRIKALVKRTFPKYRKHSVIVFDHGAFTNHGSYWDGGSRQFYATCNKHGGRLNWVNGPSSPPQFGGGDPVRVELDDDTVGLCTGTFRGKQATLTIYATPKTYRWLIEGQNNV